MKQVSQALSQHLSQPVVTLARLLQITRMDGKVRSYTDHDADVTYGGATIVANVPWAGLTVSPDSVPAGGSGTSVEFVAASQILQPLSEWTITIGSSSLCGVSDCAVARTTPGSLVVVDWTPITFGGSTVFDVAPTMTSDVIELAIDAEHDYWFFIYGPYPGNGNWYLNGVEWESGGSLANFMAIKPNTGTDIIGVSPLAYPWSAFTNNFWIQSWQAVGSPLNTYQSNTGLTFSALESKDDASPTNTEVTGFLDDIGETGISEADVRAKLYDNATFQLSAVNWNDLTQGGMKLLSGTIGDIKMENGKYTMQLRGLTQYLTTKIGSVYGPTCRATLFGGGSTLIGGQVIDPTNHWRCGLNQADWVQNGTIGTSADSLTIVPAGTLSQKGVSYPGTAPAPTDWFADGLITFTSGALDGYAFEIQSWDGTTLGLFGGAPMPFAPAAGDTYTIEPGCSKMKIDCENKFHNIINFAAEAEIPGLNVLVATSSAQVPTP